MEDKDKSKVKEQVETARPVKSPKGATSEMKSSNKKRFFWIWTGVGLLLSLIVVLVSLFLKTDDELLPELDPVDLYREQSPEWVRTGKYWETHRLTPNIYEEETNDVKGIVLHHTAYEGPTATLIDALCNPKSDVSCHVVIDKDGTRYVLAPPEAVTWHAGYSYWRGRFRANQFMIGIEFQGNTLEEPLTDEQIESAIEYIRPIVKKYNIPKSEVVTHQMIRDAYRKAVPKNKKAWPKVDIVPEEYHRVLHALDTARVFKKKIESSRFM